MREILAGSMAKPPSPLVGYNNNVRHKNRVFHIQTEDSGIGRPHIITHLFMDGGRILKSVKTSYAEHVGAEGMAETVRQMMKDQHKAMFIALRDGQFDAAVDGRVEPRASVQGGAGGAAPPGSPAPVVASGTSGDARDPVDARAEGGEVLVRPSLPDGTLRPIPEGASLRASIPDSTAFPLPLPPPAPRLTPPPRRPPSEPGHLAPAAGRLAGSSFSPTPAAPPVADVPFETPSGDGRYAPARPAAIFDTPRPARAAQSASIFGEDLIGDKSLDEVILSYLAEDLEGERK